jgi:hypothetical protein
MDGYGIVVAGSDSSDLPKALDVENGVNYEVEDKRQPGNLEVFR